MTIRGAAPLPVMVSALQERMCRMTGAVADGALPWLAPPDHVAEVIMPAVAAGAEEAGRPMPPVIAGFPAFIADDTHVAREAVRHAIGLSADMPSYQQLLGATGIESWLDAALDTVVASGDAEALRRRAAEYIDAGVDELMVAPLTDDAATFAALSELSASG